MCLYGMFIFDEVKKMSLRAENIITQNEQRWGKITRAYRECSGRL